MDFTPPQLDAVHPETGFSFALSDETFSRWWTATVLPEDASEFVYLFHGTIEEARFVCAVDYLVNVQREDYGSDVVLKAYFLAKNQPIDLRDSQAKVNAHYLTNSDAVIFLLDRVRARARRIAEERIASLTSTKIEELYERAKGLEGEERLKTERAALETAIKYLGNQSRERGQESDRRMKKAAQAAMERGKNSEYDTKRLPSLAEAKLHIAMLIDGYGPDAIADLVKESVPKALPDADQSRT